MPRHTLLNNVAHKATRVITDYSATMGDNQMCTLAIPAEFRQIQSEYAIFFHQNQADSLDLHNVLE